MPKRIANVNDKIIDSAIKLFSQKGYNNVKMNDIAVHSHIAVGTLYNYYKDKRSLFWVVIERHLDNIYSKLTDIVTNKEKISITELITIIYDEITNMKGFSGELLDFSEEEGHNIKKLKNEFITYIDKFLSKNRWKGQVEFVDKYHDRIIFIILLTIINLSKEFPAEREKNIEFIRDLIGKFVS